MVIRHFFPKWSAQWFSRVSQWQAHNERHAEHLTSKLLAWRREDYLRNFRHSFVPQNLRVSRGFISFAGRLDPRGQPGRPPSRWADGFKYIRSTSWSSRKTPCAEFFIFVVGFYPGGSGCPGGFSPLSVKLKAPLVNATVQRIIFNTFLVLRRYRVAAMKRKTEITQ